MKHTITTIAAAGLLGAAAFAGGSAPSPDDGFPREGKNRESKDALEGEAPPPLQVEGWLNFEGDSLQLTELRGKVVVIDFWGTW